MTIPTEDLSFIRPATGERIAVGPRVQGSPVEKLFTGVPKVGLVISTFGALPYVDLHLAVRQRVYPDLPVLVHDDASGQTNALAELCRVHGVTFQTNSIRMGHEMGDISSMIGGLRWAKEIGLDLVVKMSRRFVPNTNWVPRLQHMATVSQYPTFGRDCKAFGYALRTECFAMAVGPWSADEIIGEMTTFMLTNLEPFLVERFVYQMAKKVYTGLCVEARRWEQKNVRANPRPANVLWDFMSESRKTPSPTHLWHETTTPAQYAEFGLKLGRNFPPSAFEGFFSQAGS
jgi:hypothetical protein